MHEQSAGAWSIDDIAWDEVGADGTRYALLEGDRSTPGSLFSYAFFIPAGFWDPPHHHSTDARVFVAGGRLALGYGATAAPERLSYFAAGSFLLVPAGAPHFDGAEEATLIFGVAAAPWWTVYVDPAHRPSAGTPQPRS